MSKWISDAYLDFILDEIVKSDGESICFQQPTTYFNAIHPDLWEMSKEYVVGDTITPPTIAGFIYECVSDGTSGGTEPGWGVTQDVEFDDGTTRWKTHENYTLAYTDIPGGDLTIEDGDLDGRKVVIPQYMGVITHDSGTVTHCAFVEHATKTLHMVTTADTTIPEDDDVVSGRTTIFFGMTVNIRDPQ